MLTKWRDFVWAKRYPSPTTIRIHLLRNVTVGSFFHSACREITIPQNEFRYARTGDLKCQRCEGIEARWLREGRKPTDEPILSWKRGRKVVLVRDGKGASLTSLSQQVFGKP